MSVHAIAPARELPPGTRRVVEILGRSIAVLNVDGAFYAVRNRCPHQGGPLGEGPVTRTVVATRETGWRPEPAYAGRVLRCPWHGLEIDLATGASIGNPRWRCRVYETRVNADGIVEVVL